MLFDGQGRCLTTNQTGLSLMDVAWEDSVGKKLGEFWAPEIRQTVDESVRTVLSGTACSFEAHRDLGNRMTWWDVSLSPVFDERGGVRRFIAIGTDVTERRHGEERVQKHVAYMESLCEVGRAITSTPDLTVTLKTLLRHVRSRLHVDAASVLLYSAGRGRLHYGESEGFRSRRITGTFMKLGYGFAGEAARSRTTVSIPDFSRYRGPYALADSYLVREEGFGAYVGVPLVGKGKIVGVLELFQRTTFQPDEEWYRFATAVAEQAAIAIDSGTMFGELQDSRNELIAAYDATIEGWARALDYRDRETVGHSRRVTELTVRLAQRMGADEEMLVHIRRGALLHDIGKLGVPDSILLKKGPLTERETTLMRRHPEIADAVISPIPFLRKALDIPLYHHERWDGTGYPHGLKGNAIPLPARIFALVDILDALRSDRPYRVAWSQEKTLTYIRSLAGTHLDPAVVEAFFQMEQKQSLSGLAVSPP